MSEVEAQSLPRESEPSLYERIGEDFIVNALTEFYIRAFGDMMIGHFFFGKDREELTQQQIDFTAGLLGGPRRYRGRPLAAVHRPLPLRTPHFNRRQVLMREVLDEMGLDAELARRWLELENSLRPLIIPPKTGATPCST